MFIFDGGILSETQIAAINTNPEEHHGFAFVEYEDLGDYLGERLLKRMRVCFKNLQNNEGGLYLEKHEKIS